MKIDNSDHPEERRRVTERIGATVQEFFKAIESFPLADNMFHLDELAQFCRERFNAYVSPESAGRIMRALRQKKQLDYRCVSRSESLYQIIPKPPEPAEVSPPEPEPDVRPPAETIGDHAQ